MNVPSLLKTSLRKAMRHKGGLRSVSMLFLLGITGWLGTAFLDAKTCKDPGIRLPPYRGAITDRTGVLLAGSVPTYHLVIDPVRCPPPGSWVQEVASIAKIPPEDILRIMRQSRCPVTVGTDLSEVEKDRISALSLEGVSILTGYRRDHPSGPIASPVIGGIGGDERGLDGIEYSYDDVLRDGSGIVGGSGKDIALGIERNLQTASERQLDRQLKAFKGEKGCLVVMDVERGEILAMANNPSEAPSSPAGKINGSLPNLAIKDAVDPTLVLLLISWLDNHRFGRGAASILQEKQGTDEGTCRWSWAGSPAGFQVLSPWSQEELGKVRLHQGMLPYLSALGFGQKTGIDLPGEKPGRLPPYLACSWEDISSELGFTATPVQILRAFSAIINRGKLVRPTLALEEAHKRQPEFWNLPGNGDAAELPLTEGLTLLLGKDIARPDSPSLASIKWSGPAPEEGGAATDGTGQLVALGFAPAHAPEIAYILVMDGIRKGADNSTNLLGDIHRIASRGTAFSVKSLLAAGEPARPRVVDMR